MATVREFITKLGYKIDEGNLKKYNKQLDRTRKNAQGAASSIRDMFGMVFGAFSIQQISNTADEVQNLEARIAQLPQTVSSSADAFNAVNKAATLSRQPLAEFGKLYTRIGHVAKTMLPTQKELLAFTGDITKSFIVGGTAAREQAAGMMQLSQAFNKGKLDGDEFRTFIETMPGQITRALSKEMGYENMGAFEKAREQGQITIDKLVMGFKGLRTYIDDQFRHMPMTISQGLTIVSNRFSGFIAQLNRESSFVTDISRTIVEGFDLIKSGLDNINEFFGGSGQTIRAAKLLFGTWLAPKVIRGVAKAISFLGKRVFWMATALIAATTAGDDFYTWIKGGKSVTGDYIGTLDKFLTKYKNISQLLRDIKQDFIALAETMGNFYKTMRNKMLGGGSDKKSIITGLDWVEKKLGEDKKKERGRFAKGKGALPEISTAVTEGLIQNAKSFFSMWGDFIGRGFSGPRGESTADFIGGGKKDFSGTIVKIENIKVVAPESSDPQVFAKKIGGAIQKALTLPSGSIVNFGGSAK